MLHPQRHLPLERRKIPFLDRRYDGFIFVVPDENAEILELLVKHDFPAVTCYSTDVPGGVAAVVPENIVAVEQSLQLLRERGHGRVAFWSARHQHSDARERLQTYQRQMHKHNLESLVFDTTFDADNEPQLAARHVLDAVIQRIALLIL